MSRIDNTPNWKRFQIGELATINIGGTPSRSRSDFWAENCLDGLPWVSIADLNQKYISETKEYITAKGASNSNTKLVKSGTVIMSFKLSLGRVAVAGVDLYTNEAIVSFVPQEKISSDFLYYILPDAVKNTVTDNAIKGATLNKESIRKIVLEVPSKDVQQEIILILNEIDKAIEKTNALINKYSQIKSGLMHDLFTRGVHADGKLRPTREQAPELYKETPIGWLPKEWRCKELVNLLAPVANNLRSGPFGSALLKAELVEDGIPFLGIDNIHVEHFVPIYKRFVSGSKFNHLRKYAVRERDVVITIMGTVGRCAVVPADIPDALSSKHLWTMTFDQSTVLPELVCWQLNYAAWVKSWFRRETQGGIMDAIQSRTLKTLRLPVPPMAEQKTIFNKYSAITSTILYENMKLIKLRKEKQGLMNDLLKGEV